MRRLRERSQSALKELASEARTVRPRASSTHLVPDPVQYALGREPHRPRRERANHRLESDLSERAAFDRLLEETPLTKAALETCLQFLPRAGLVLDSDGEVLLANPLARTMVEANPGHLADELRACTEGRSTAFLVTRLPVHGAAPYWFALETARLHEPALLLTSAKARWSLTEREGQTLALLAEGLSNRAIAANLECAERTVEVHVARLLSKSKSGNRSELIARFWREDHMDGA